MKKLTKLTETGKNTSSNHPEDPQQEKQNNKLQQIKKGLPTRRMKILQRVLTGLPEEITMRN